MATSAQSAEASTVPTGERNPSDPAGKSRSSERDFYSTRQTLFEIGYRIYVIYERTGNWENCGGVSIYNSLEAVKKALFYEYDFSCEETAESDKFGDKIYKEN